MAPLVGPLGEKSAHLALERGIDKAVVGVLSGGFDEFHRSGAGLHHGAAQQRQRQLALEQDGRAEHFLFFAAVDGEDLVALQTGERLLKIVVQAVDAVLLRRGERAQRSALFQHLAQRAADGGIVADPLGDDVVRALQGVGERFHALFRVDKIARGVFGAGTAALLRKEQRRKRLKPLLPRNRRAGAALLLIGAVEVFDLGKRFGIVDGGGELVCKLALLVDGFFHALAPLFKAAQVLEAFFERAQRGVVHRAVHLLAVAGDEGDGIALVQQAHNVFHVLRALAELPGKRLNDIHRNSFRCMV